jgi:hypothetical protein
VSAVNDGCACNTGFAGHVPTVRQTSSSGYNNRFAASAVCLTSELEKQHWVHRSVGWFAVYVAADWPEEAGLFCSCCSSSWGCKMACIVSKRDVMWAQGISVGCCILDLKHTVCLLTSRVFPE